MEEVARFMARLISLDDRYVSHGEVQTGLSLDGRSWAPDLEEKFVEDLRERGADRDVAIAQVAGDLVGALIMLRVETERARYVVIEDMVVNPEQRARGVGGELVRFAEADAHERGFEWAFLESGLENHGAHKFFERLGYAPVSKVFARRLPP